MKNNEFAHLHLHTEFSALDGFGSAGAYAKEASRLGFEYLAITDHGNVDGTIDFQKQCIKNNIKPIIGCELYVVPDMRRKEKGDKRGHLTVLIEDMDGWRTLCKWLSTANDTGFYHRPRCDFGQILISDLKGLVFLTGCAGSVITLPGGEEFIRYLYKKSDGNVYAEIMPHEICNEKKLYDLLAEEFDYLLPIATNDCHYVLEEDWEAQEVLLAIQTNSTWKDPKRWTFGIKGLHLRSADEMLIAFNKQGHWERKVIHEAMENAAILAQRCSNFRIEKQEISLPELPYEVNTIDGQPIKEFTLLEDLCYAGMTKFGLDGIPEYENRLNEELDLIFDKKFERYFLLVLDFIQHCRKQGWGIGPGRGSVGGSLLAHLIGITEGVDPIKYNLRFGRFLSANRVDWPDIDIDVEKRYRQQAVDYLYETYGAERTCGISTDMRLKGKAIIRDLGRVFELPSSDVSSMAFSIWDGREVDGSTIKAALESSQDAQAFQDKYPHIIKLALKIEGQLRGFGRHAAGVVISGDDLTNGSRCVLARRSGDNIAANWNMENSEYCGLMKLDVLGLATISVLKEAEGLINQRECTDFYYHPESNCYFHSDKFPGDTCEEIDFKLELIPEEDPASFKLISKGKTAGLFQVSAKPLTELCIKMGVESFTHLRDALALVRPGPFESGMTAQYIARKHGEKYQSIHSIHDKITKTTYGVLLFQEQIMQVISMMASMTESDADHVRKIIAKKRDPAELEKYKNEFIQGCLTQKTFNEKQALQFWDDLSGWAKYGFGAAHATAYALITYRTAYLKAHYPTEFFCAVLTYGEYNEKSKDINKRKQYIINEAIEYGLSIMPPKINLSNAIKWVAKDKVLYAPFVELNGIGESGAENCVNNKTCLAPKQKGFFNLDPRVKKKTKIDEILEFIKASDPEAIPDNLKNYLPFTCFKQEQKKEKQGVTAIRERSKWKK